LYFLYIFVAIRSRLYESMRIIHFVLFTVAGYSQNSINNYKYVLVPERFDFSRENNQYGLSTTTKLMLEQKGFVAFVGNQGLPPTLACQQVYCA